MDFPRFEGRPSLGRLTSRGSRLFFAAATLVVWCALLAFPEPASGHSLDLSWTLALGHFMKTGAQAGKDYVFTYGPLGYLASPLFFPGLFGVKYLWAAVFSAASAIALVRFATCLPSRRLQLAWVWLVLAIVPRSEIQIPVVLVVVALLHLLEEAWSRDRLALTAVLFATVGLVKFTFLSLGATLVLALVLAAPPGLRRYVATRLVPFFLSSLAVVWLLAGQSLANVPRYLVTSNEIAQGYSVAMSFEGTPLDRAAALTFSSFLSLGAVLVVPEVWISRRYLFGTAMVLLGLFLSWKEGFVRQDPFHIVVFFGYLALSTVMLRALDGRADAPTRLLSGAFLLLAALGSVSVLRTFAHETPARFFGLSARREQTARSLETLMSPLKHDAWAKTMWRKQEATFALPAVQMRVGREPLDVMTVDQDVVLYNEFNWRPRPIFQSYSAYTPALAQLNGEFFRRSDGPRYVLSRWSSIDERFPADDDGPALIELFRRYRPVLSEQDFLLLERLPNEAISSGQGERVLHRRLAFDERLPLTLEPQDLYTLAVRVKPTIAGRVRRFLFSGPRLVLIVQPTRGKRKRFELIPHLASVPFILSPLVEGNADLSRIYSGHGRGIVAIRFAGTDEVRHAFGDSVEVTIWRYPGVS